VIELHGTLSQVKCLDCDLRETRKALQERLRELNGGAENVGLQPDGDAEVTEESYAKFVTVGCSSCGGILKPTVVFFGDNVPRPVVDAAFAGVDQSDALLLLGTSLAVFSGYRFLLRAHERKLPIVAINLGEMRGAELCDVLVAQPLGAALGELSDLLVSAK
jgi:NAD-dependent SIR2 family protein deacetylase